MRCVCFQHGLWPFVWRRRSSQGRRDSANDHQARAPIEPRLQRQPQPSPRQQKLQIGADIYFGKNKGFLDPMISITVDVQGVSGWTVLVTCRANEPSCLEMFGFYVTSESLSHIRAKVTLGALKSPIWQLNHHIVDNSIQIYKGKLSDLVLLNRTVVAISVDVQRVSSWAMFLTDRTLKTRGLQVFGFHVNMHHWGAVRGEPTFWTLIVRIRTAKDMQLDCLFHPIWENKEKINISNHLFIVLVSSLMNTQCIFGQAKLGASWAKITGRSDMVCLYVASQVGQVLGGVGTVGAAPRAIRLILQHFWVHLRLKIFKFKS